MKRLCLPALLAVCLLLAGCANSAKKQYEQFSAGLSGRSDLSFTAQLSAEYTDRTVEFTLQYEQNEDGCTVTVTAPALISGVRARFSAGGSAIDYDGIVVDTGELDACGLTPMSALPLLVDALKNGDLAQVCRLVGNVFEQALPPDSEVFAIRRQLSELGADAACMTGSGSAVMGLFRQEETARGRHPPT